MSKKGTFWFSLEGVWFWGRMATCQEAFPIQEDEHLLVVLRYVERNALRARLVRRGGRRKRETVATRSGLGRWNG
jgi:hypothetical protein